MREIVVYVWDMDGRPDGVTTTWYVIRLHWRWHAHGHSSTCTSLSCMHVACRYAVGAAFTIYFNERTNRGNMPRIGVTKAQVKEACWMMLSTTTKTRCVCDYICSWCCHNFDDVRDHVMMLMMFVIMWWCWLCLLSCWSTMIAWSTHVCTRTYTAHNAHTYTDISQGLTATYRSINTIHTTICIHI